MESLTIKELLERAASLDTERQDKFLTDLPLNHLKCLELVAMMYGVDQTDPELFAKIKRRNKERQKAIVRAEMKARRGTGFAPVTNELKTRL